MRNFKSGRSRSFREQHNSSRSFGRHRPNGSNGRGGYRNKGAALNPMMFVKKAVDVVEAVYVPVNSFSDFPLDETVQKNILARGFSKPTPVQDQAMLPILEGREDRKSTRLNSSHIPLSRMPSSA